jgi:DNA (cytosine-5)-methyltransferase 1
MKIASLFSGCGGLDLGFENAGFEVVYANDIDKAVWETFEKNHNLKIDRRSIVDVKSEEIPEVDGIIGGPPCQSWSLAGAMRGINDSRGRLFYEYIRILKDKKPLFFVAENVPGIISSTHLPEFNKILEEFSKIGYNISYKLLDARDYGVPQERKRVVVVGLRKDFGKKFEFPEPTHSPDGKTKNKWVNLKEAIGELPAPMPAKEKNKTNDTLEMPNQEYMNGGFSTIYMSRNRRKNWDDQSFTIQAGGRHAPLHPDSAKMHKIGEDKWEFEGKSPKHRRLSVRECARIQTFPDDFIFYYDSIADGYKMIGNAVPVKLAEAVAKKIIKDLHVAKIEVKIKAIR